MKQYACKIRRASSGGAGLVDRGTLTFAAANDAEAKARVLGIIEDLENASGDDHFYEWLDKGGKPSTVPVAF
jgi:hypothetical protein